MRAPVCFSPYRRAGNTRESLTIKQSPAWRRGPKGRKMQIVQSARREQADASGGSGHVAQWEFAQ